MTVLHTFNYIDLKYNNGNTINIQDINNLTNFLGVQTQVSTANIQNAITLLIRDYNMFTATCQLDNLIKKHSTYSGTSIDTTNNGTALYDSIGAEATLTGDFRDVDLASAYSFVTKVEQVLTLGRKISNNTLLQQRYVATTNQGIQKKLLYFRSLILAYTTVAITGSDANTKTLSYDSYFIDYGFCPLFNVWSSIASITSGAANGLYEKYFVPNDLKPYVTPLTGYDITFLRFFSQIIKLGISNLLIDIDNQNAIITYGIDVLQVIAALGIALDVTIFQDDDITTLSSNYDFLLFVTTVQNVLNFCIPILNDVKNKVLMNGLPSYYIIYCLFVLCMLNIRNEMITLASLNNSALVSSTYYGGQLYFYALEDNSVYTVNLTVPGTTMLFSQVGFL
jgi:hypothetical protein